MFEEYGYVGTLNEMISPRFGAEKNGVTLSARNLSPTSMVVSMEQVGTWYKPNTKVLIKKTTGIMTMRDSIRSAIYDLFGLLYQRIMR